MEFIGPIPSTFPQEFANSVLGGADKCLMILRLLLDYFDAEESTSGGGNPDNNADPLPFRIVSKLGAAKTISFSTAATEIAAEKWLDHVAASMGLEAFDIVTCATETGPVLDEVDTEPWNESLSLR